MVLQGVGKAINRQEPREISSEKRRQLGWIHEELPGKDPGLRIKLKSNCVCKEWSSLE